MKTSIILFILTCLFTAFSMQSFSQGKLSSKDYKIAGKVYKTTDYKYTPEEIEGIVEKGKLVEKSISQFSENGSLLHIIDYDPNDKIISERIFEFNDKNRLIFEKWQYKEGVSEKYEFLYDSLGFLVRVNQYKEDSITSFHEYKNDINGNVIEETVYSNSRGLLYELFKKYNEKNQMIEEKTNYYGELIGTSKLVIDYDIIGNIVQRTLYDYEDRIDRKTTYSFDTLNRLINEINYNYGKDYEKTITYFHDGSFKTHEVKSEYGDNEETTDINYDKYGNITEFYSTSQRFGTSRHYINQYKYDSVGNWYEWISYNLDKNDVKTYNVYRKRKIEYFR